MVMQIGDVVVVVRSIGFYCRILLTNCTCAGAATEADFSCEEERQQRQR
jgi:hypothetical protein